MKTLILENIGNIVGGQANGLPHLVQLYKSEEDFSIDVSAENIANWKKLPNLVLDQETDLFFQRNLKSIPGVLILTIDESNHTYKIYRVV